LPIIQGCSGTFNLLQDVGSFGGPDEGLWLFIVLVDGISDGHNQFFDVAEDPSA
jgi:hypothetical protein